MARTVKALINPELLVWARETVHMSVPQVAKTAKIAEATLASWEAGTDAPSVSKLRALAKIYKRPLAVFYLPERPRDFSPMKDFRRQPGELAGTLTPTLAAQITAANQRRELAIELYAELGEEIPELNLTANVTSDPEHVGQAIREALSITVEHQKSWREDRLAYNAWRERIESRGIMVFQTTKVGVKEARGFAIAAKHLPIIAVNGRDWYTARTFSLMHELAHILLGESSISDYSDATADEPRLPAAARIEVFCNAVAAATLLPKDAILRHHLVINQSGPIWASETLAELARDFAVSEEAILRRLLTLGKTTRGFYQSKRKGYEELAARLAAKKSKGGPAPHIATLARYGAAYARLILQGYYQNRLTLADVSGYLSLKLPHIRKLESAAYGVSAR